MPSAPNKSDYFSKWIEDTYDMELRKITCIFRGYEWLLIVAADKGDTAYSAFMQADSVERGIEKIYTAISSDTLTWKEDKYRTKYLQSSG